MTLYRFDQLAQDNTGFRRVVESLTDHFSDVVPGGFPMTFSYFLRCRLIEPKIYTHTSIAHFPKREDDDLCFIRWMYLGASDMEVDINPHTKSRKDPLEILGEILSETPSGANLFLENVFVVRYNPDLTIYTIEIHRYPPAFFQTMVLENPELLRMVVQKHIRINDAQLELTPEVLLGDYTD